jgi:outer membrane protein OmpA-like peptidoglycan-associated protein
MARTDLVAALLSIGCVVSGGVLWSMALRAQREVSVPAPAVVPAAPEAAAVASAAPCPPAAPAAPEGAAAPAPAASVQLVEGKLDLRFVRGDALLLKEDRGRAVAVATRLARSDYVKVSIEGFADEPGPDKRSLAKKRAAAVRALLVERGVDLERISVTLGEVSKTPDGAGLVRLHTTPPLPEADTKAP